MSKLLNQPDKGLKRNKIISKGTGALSAEAKRRGVTFTAQFRLVSMLTHCGRVTQICVFNTVELGTSASSP